jgi:hypothetical protein
MKSYDVLLKLILRSIIIIIHVNPMNVILLHVFLSNVVAPM